MEKNKAFIIRGNNVIGMDVQRVYTSTPIGIIQAFSGTTIPRGFLLCDGASYKVADYPDLYAVIGNTYGGDSTNFNVPNLIDKFIQGSTTSGTEKEAGLPNITGEAWIRVREGSSTADSIEQTTGAFTRGSSHTLKRATAVADESATKSLKIDASLSNPIYGNSDTVQPPALTMVYIIKAFHTNEGADTGVSDDVVEYVAGELDKKAAIDDAQTSTDTVWSSKKTSNELATKQENMSVRKIYARRNSSANKYILLSTIDMSKITYIGQPLRIKGVIGNMASDITNIDLVINARNGFVKKILSGTVTHKNFLTNYANIIITKSDDEKTAYVYLYCISTYGYIDAEIYLGSVHYSVPSTFDLVGTMQGTEYTNLLDTNYVVIENVINDTTSSITSTYSSAKINEKIAKHSLPIVFDSGIINNSTVQVYKLANVGYTASGGTDAYNLNLLLSSRGAEEIELIGGKNDGGWIIEAIRNNKSFNKITNIYQDGLDIYVRLDLRCNYFRVYHKSGVLSGDFAVSLVDTVPATATELTVTEYATKKDIDGTTIKTTSTTGSEYYAITFKDKQFERGNNQGILIQHNRLNFEPLTFIFSASSYNTAVYERDNYDVTKVNGSVYNPTSPYMMQFYMDKANNTLYLSVPSYSGVTLTDLQFKSDVVSYTKVNAVPNTATKITVTEYATKADLGSNVPMTEIAFTNSTNWSNSSGNLKTFYMVRNGWCFLHVVAHCNKVASDNNSVVYSGLPMPPFQVYGKFVGEDNTYEPCNLTVATNGQMLLRAGTAGKDYSFTYTYPVA